MVAKQGKTVVTTDPNADPANIPPAETFDPSGAPVQTSGEIDTGHPAVDANPREKTSVDQNRIDFNDPTISGQEAVERNLGAEKG